MPNVAAFLRSPREASFSASFGPAEVLAGGLCPGVGAARFAECERVAEVLVGEAGLSCGLRGEPEEVVDGAVGLRSPSACNDPAAVRLELVVEDRCSPGVV